MKYRKFMEMLFIMSSSIILSSCGKAVQMQEVVDNAPAIESSVEAASTATSPVLEVKSNCEERELYKGYVAQIIDDDAPLTTAYNNSEVITKIPADTLVNVTHELYKDGSLVNVVKIEYITDNGEKLVGYMNDNHLSFAIQTTDAASIDNARAIEGGDDEQAADPQQAASNENTNQTEKVEVSAEVSLSEKVIYMPEVSLYSEPKTMYSIKACNIRQFDSKDSDLIASINQNTAVTVNGETKSGWYQINYDGVNAFIKKTLLSDAKVEQKVSSPSVSGVQSEQVSQPSQDITVQKLPETKSDEELIAQMEAVLGGLSHNTGYGGTTGYVDGSGWEGVTFE